jgi:hypothetical protein
MTIGEQTIQWYEQNEPDGFAPALLRCFLFGVVVKRPEFLLMAEEVLTDGERIIAVSPDCSANCWWVHVVIAPKATVTPLDFMAEAPYALEYVAFKRRGKTRIYSWSHMRKDVHNGRSTIRTSTIAA